MDENDLKKYFKGVQETLKRDDLSEEERQKFETLSNQLAGALLSSWLPAGVIRKIIMFILVLGGFYNIIHGGFIYSLILFAIASSFSPRIIGELAVAFGRIKRK